MGTRYQCTKNFSLFADPRFSIQKNVTKIQKTTNNLDIPQKPQNLQLHNLCNNKSLVIQDLIDTLGLGLGHGVTTKQPQKNPIDFERLRRQI